MQFRPFYRILPHACNAVLFVHGIVGTPAHFQELIPLVPEDWSVYNILLDGHGGDVEDFARTSMKKWKDQVHGVLEEILSTHSRVFLVGHSMGTLFCIRESFLFPGRIPGLFLLNVPLHPWVRPAFIPHILLAALGKGRPGSSAAMLLSDCSVHLSPRLWKYLAWLPRYLELVVECCRVRRLISSLDLPCICIQSACDELVRRKSFRFLSGQSNLTVWELPDSGHFGYTPEDLKRIQAVFLSFLNS